VRLRTLIAPQPAGAAADSRVVNTHNVGKQTPKVTPARLGIGERFDNLVRNERWTVIVMISVLLGGLAVGAAIQDPTLHTSIAFLAAIPVLVIARELNTGAKRVQRLRKQAGIRLDRPRLATLRGRALRIGKRLEAPFSRRKCIGYWATSPAMVHWRNVQRFLIRVGGEQVVVETEHVKILRDPGSGEGARIDARHSSDDEAGVFMPMDSELMRVRRFQETLIIDEDEIVVRGVLSRVEGRMGPPGSRLPAYRLTGTASEPVVIIFPGSSVKASSEFGRQRRAAARRRFAELPRVVRIAPDMIDDAFEPSGPAIKTAIVKRPSPPTVRLSEGAPMRMPEEPKVTVRFVEPLPMAKPTVMAEPAHTPAMPVRLDAARLLEEPMATMHLVTADMIPAPRQQVAPPTVQLRACAPERPSDAATMVAPRRHTEDMKPIIVVPKSFQVTHMIEAAPLSIEPRAQRVGIIVIMPRGMRPADLMVACHFWPSTLREAGVKRVAVVLDVEAYVLAKGIFESCRFKMREQRIEIEYFHEAHFESDQIRAWFEGRRPRRHVSTDVFVRLSERYASRGDMRAAAHALRLAEAASAESVAA